MGEAVHPDVHTIGRHRFSPWPVTDDVVQDQRRTSGADSEEALFSVRLPACHFTQQHTLLQISTPLHQRLPLAPFAFDSPCLFDLPVSIYFSRLLHRTRHGALRRHSECAEARTEGVLVLRSTIQERTRVYTGIIYLHTVWVEHKVNNGAARDRRMENISDSAHGLDVASRKLYSLLPGCSSFIFCTAA